jgi:hypothetical protein
MSIAISLDSVPLDEYEIQVSDDEPAEAMALIAEQVRKGMRGRPSVDTLNVFVEQANARAAKNDGRPTEKMRRAMYALANELKLSRDDRLELAEMLLNKEVESWGTLSFDEAGKMLTAMNGYTLIRHLRTRK